MEERNEGEGRGRRGGREVGDGHKFDGVTGWMGGMTREDGEKTKILRSDNRPQ